MKPKSILITGNMGYVGPSVVRQLKSAYPEAKIIGFDIGYFAHCLTGASLLPESLLDQQVFGDIRKLPADLLQGVDAVISLAAISNDPMGKAFEQVTMDINYASNIALAEKAREAGVSHFVFASSCSVYGFAESGARKEEDSLNPLTAYARSKHDSELALADLATDNFRVTCLRFPTACGMSDRLRLDLVLNDFVASAVATGSIEILSDGTPWRPLIDTKDMALAIDWALQRQNEANFIAINAGHDVCNYQILDLAKAVQKHIPGTEISVNEDAAPDKRSYRVDFSLYQELAADYLPRCTLAQSIAELHAGLVAMDFAEAGFRDSPHMRLRVLGNHIEAGRIDGDLTLI